VCGSRAQELMRRKKFFTHKISTTLTIKCNHTHLGFTIEHDDNRDWGFISSIIPNSTAAKIPSYHRQYIGAYFLRVNNTIVQHADNIRSAFAEARHSSDSVTVVLAPDPYQLVKDCTNIPLHLDNDQLAAIHSL
jgi:hypothetical protein